MSMRVVACHDRQTADRKSEITMAVTVPTTSTVVFDTNCGSEMRVFGTVASVV